MNTLINNYTSTRYLIIQLNQFSFVSHQFPCLFIHRGHQFFVVVNMEHLCLFVLMNKEHQFFDGEVQIVQCPYLCVLVNKECLIFVIVGNQFSVKTVGNQFSMKTVGIERQILIKEEGLFFVWNEHQFFVVKVNHWIVHLIFFDALVHQVFVVVWNLTFLEENLFFLGKNLFFLEKNLFFLKNNLWCRLVWLAMLLFLILTLGRLYQFGEMLVRSHLY